MSGLSIEQKRMRLMVLHYQTLLLHKLPEIELRFVRDDKNLGMYYPYEWIEMSLDFIERLPFKESKDTLLHEMAHHMHQVEYSWGYPDNDIPEIDWHNDDWKMCCKFLGAKPEATYKDKKSN
jgi:hypothetical protein